MITGTYTKGNTEGIFVYKFNSSTGEVKKVSAAVSQNPSYLALSKDKRFVYAANENGDGKGGVSAFSFDESTGALRKINEQLSHGDHPCYIAVDLSNKWVAVGNYTGGNFSVYPILENGGIGPAAQIIEHSGSSVVSDRQEKPHVHATIFSPDGKYLAVVDLGTDKIMLYPFHPEKEKPVDEKAVEVMSAPGSGPRHLIYHTKLPYAYVIEELSGNVAVYDTRTVPYKQVQSIRSHPAEHAGEIGSAAVKISNDGKFVYASNRGESNTISVYSIDAASGKLSSKGFVKSGGKGPRDFTIDPSDSFLLSANGGSDKITIFKRNKSTGMPEETGKSVSVHSPVCIVFL